MPVVGKLILKGGLHVTSTGVSKKHKKKKTQQKELTEEDRLAREEQRKAQAISVQGNGTYEEEFALEMAKAKQGKTKNTPWGSSFSAPPEILHGYTKKVKGSTAEERLDIRSAMKSDKIMRRARLQSATDGI